MRFLTSASAFRLVKDFSIPSSLQSFPWGVRGPCGDILVLGVRWSGIGSKKSGGKLTLLTAIYVDAPVKAHCVATMSNGCYLTVAFILASAKATASRIGHAVWSACIGTRQWSDKRPDAITTSDCYSEDGRDNERLLTAGALPSTARTQIGKTPHCFAHIIPGHVAPVA